MGLPLFPLGSVLFPGGRVPLQVFEPRYVDLVRASLKNNSEFGVVWIREGSEVVIDKQAPMPRLAQIGTFARIVDWDALPGGRLGVTIEGSGKFRLLATEQQTDYLVLADVEPLPCEAALPLPERATDLLALLRQLIEHPLIARLKLEPELADVGRLANQVAQLLPIQEANKFELLAELEPLQRLDRLLLILEQLSD
jgi:Lon protease-like protein